MLVIGISTTGILGIAGFLIAVSPFNKWKTAFGILGGIVTLAIVDWIVEAFTYRIAALSNYIPTAFGNYPAYRGVPWWTFPVLHNSELPLMYSAIAIVPVLIVLILARVARKGN